MRNWFSINKARAESKPIDDPSLDSLTKSLARFHELMKEESAVVTKRERETIQQNRIIFSLQALVLVILVVWASVELIKRFRS